MINSYFHKIPNSNSLYHLKLIFLILSPENYFPTIKMKTEASEHPEIISANYNMEHNQELTVNINCTIEEIDENTICYKEELTCEPMIEQFLDNNPSNYDEMLPLPDPEKSIEKSAKLHTLAANFYGQQLKQNQEELSKFKPKVKKSKRT